MVTSRVNAGNLPDGGMVGACEAMTFTASGNGDENYNA